jgi:hypothetical protein
MPYTQKTWNETIRDLEHTFDLWGVTTWAVEPRTNPRKIYQSAAERTVTVLWVVRGQQLGLTLGEHDTASENLRAIYNSIEDARKIEGRGAAELMRQIFKQLPGPTEALALPAGAATVDPYSVLGLQPGAPRSVAEAAYRALAKTAHPNAGGDRAAWDRLQAAIEQIRSKQ